MGGAVTGPRFALETAGADCFEITIRDFAEGSQFWRSRLGGLADDGESVRAEKRRTTRKQVEENGAETIDIGGRF